MSAELSVCIGLGISVNSVCVYDVYTCAGADCQTPHPCQLDCLPPHQLISLCGRVLVCSYACIMKFISPRPIGYMAWALGKTTTHAYE